VTAAPVFLPSTWNCTLVVLEETLVEMVMVPETMAPDAGAVMKTVGAVFGDELLAAPPPLHPMQSSARPGIKHNQRTAPA